DRPCQRGDRMRRRELLGLIGAAAMPSVAALAQQQVKPATIGFLSPNSAAVASPWTAAFVARLRELGWTEGRNVQIEFRFEDGQVERTAEFVADLIGRKVDLIVTHGVQNILAAKQVTPGIPVVFALASDPVASGFVASLSRP